MNSDINKVRGYREIHELKRSSDHIWLKPVRNQIESPLYGYYHLHDGSAPLILSIMKTTNVCV